MRVRTNVRDEPDGFGYLPVELFETERSQWVLDVNRVEFVRVDDVAFDVIGCLRREQLTAEEIARQLPGHPREEVEEAFREVASAQERGFFLPGTFHRTPKFRSDDYRFVLNDHMGGLTISLTTRCNLSCSYCVFGGGYSRYPRQPESTMTWSVLQNALNFLLEHSRKSKGIRVLFFGGEPLIAFTLIRRAVAHVRAALSGDPRELEIVICTNGTILSPAILSFLVDNKVTVQFSLDGDRETHDRYRRFRTGKRGSFDTVLRNLQFISERNPEYYRQFVRIKGVVDPGNPGAQSNVFQEPLIKELTDRGHVSFVLLERHYDAALDAAYFTRLHELGGMLLRKEGVSTLDELLEDCSPAQKEFFRQSYGWFFAAQAVERIGRRGHRELPFSKGCMIGAKEGHVGPDGSISICEKAQNGQAFVIGNVNDGTWDFSRIDHLNQWLHDCDGCSSCFVQKFCDLCFEKIEGDEKKLNESRTHFCSFMRLSMRTVIKGMLEVMDRNPRLWEEVVRYVNKRVAGERAEREKALLEL